MKKIDWKIYVFYKYTYIRDIMDPKITRKGKEKNQLKDKSVYKYNNKRVRQYENMNMPKKK